MIPLSLLSVGSAHPPPPLWLLLPFVSVLLMIALFPVLFKNFWHRYHPHVCVGLGLLVPLYYIGRGNHEAPIHAFFEYFQFISLIFSLYTASNLINIQVTCNRKVVANVIFLFAGGVLSNLIGTTGASMLLIKPFIHLNKGRIQAYHIVFFIFVISNVGGALTPIGDPPLFLGFLKGVPFFWMLRHITPSWLFTMAALLLVFYLMDRQNKAGGTKEEVRKPFRLAVRGTKNAPWLLLIVGAVFLDPNLIEGLPHIAHEGRKISFIRELIMLSAGFFSHRYASKKMLKMNQFSMSPVREVAFLFVGIFGTMIPAIEWIHHHGSGSMGAILTPSVLYWSTGILSGFLDNAPTYLNFLAASMSSHHASILSFSEVAGYAKGALTPESIKCLQAISSGAVFFGAFSYIGNGPNFMVHSIAKNLGVEMPEFLSYIVKYSLRILLPVLVLTWLFFIYL